MSEKGDTLLKWLAGVASTASVGIGIVAITLWADVREMKGQVAASVKAVEIAQLRGELAAHEIRAQEKGAALQREIDDLKEGQRALWRVRGTRAPESP